MEAGSEARAGMRQTSARLFRSIAVVQSVDKQMVARAKAGERNNLHTAASVSDTNHTTNELPAQRKPNPRKGIDVGPSVHQRIDRALLPCAQH